MHHDAVIAQAHLGHAVHELLSQSDLSGDALALAARILDVQDTLSEWIGPASSVPPSGGAKSSLESAIHYLVLAADPVANNALAELSRVLVEVNHRGQR
ncbi:hypothetical protein PROP_01094 [Propionicimonas sp. T2.31MG-18]|jgi:hypothetical protein|uniref:hypothetical protein n=1 Tax=Propionicimonas sp. T2.31MG-18 TaxID=3157620 RepID=UPI0035E6C304